MFIDPDTCYTHDVSPMMGEEAFKPLVCPVFQDVEKRSVSIMDRPPLQTKRKPGKCDGNKRSDTLSSLSIWCIGLDSSIS